MHFFESRPIYGIGFTKEQLSNICMICNGYDANKYDTDNCYRSIKYIDRCMKLTDIKGRGLMVSSLGARPSIAVDSKINYKFYVKVKITDRFGNPDANPDFLHWRELRTFDEEGDAI